jgi:hypothetical protein
MGSFPSCCSVPRARRILPPPPVRTLSARVRSCNQLAQVLDRDPCAERRRREAAVAEQLLHVADVGSSAKETSRARMPPLHSARTEVAHESAPARLDRPWPVLNPSRYSRRPAQLVQGAAWRSRYGTTKTTSPLGILVRLGGRTMQRVEASAPPPCIRKVEQSRGRLHSLPGSGTSRMAFALLTGSQYGFPRYGQGPRGVGPVSTSCCMSGFLRPAPPPQYPCSS